MHVGAAVASTLTWLHCGFDSFKKHKSAYSTGCFGNPLPFVSCTPHQLFVFNLKYLKLISNFENMTRIFIMIKIAANSFQLGLQQGIELDIMVLLYSVPYFLFLISFLVAWQQHLEHLLVVSFIH